MSRPERSCLAALTVSFVLLGWAFSVLLPLFANFDEHTHVDRVGHTAREPLDQVGPDLRRTYGSAAALEAAGSPDTQGPALWERAPAERPDYRPFGGYDRGDEQKLDGCGSTCQNFQYAQPPAWYWLTAPSYMALDGRPFPETVLWLRLLDVLLVAPVVVLTWWAARQVWPVHRRRPLAAAALVATAGPLAFTAAGVNNDSLMLLTAGAALALAVAISQRGPTVRLCLALGVAMGVGLLTKVELVVMAPVIGLSVLMAPKTALARWRAALLVAVPALPGVVWWVVQQAGGGVLSPEGSEILAPASQGPWSSANVFGYAAHKVPVVLDRFWGLYGVPAFVAPPLARALLWAGTAALVGGWLATRRWRRPTTEDARLAVLALVPLMLVFAVIWASFKTYRSNGEVRALVPRYVYPALPLMALAAVSALATTARRAAPQRWARWSRWALPVGIPLLALGAGLASLLHAMRGLYGTSDASLLLDRAGAIAPLATPGPWALIILEAWAVAVAVAAVAAYNVRSGPGSSDVIEVAPRGGPGEGPGIGGQSGVGHQAEVDRLG